MTKTSKSCLILLPLLTLCPLVHAQSKVNGFISNRYQFRTTEGFEDHDVETTASLNIGSPRFQKFSFSILGAGLFDLDGREGDSPFYDINDTFSSQAVGRLYHAYVNVKDLDLVDHIRFGRQRLYRLEPFYFDGLYMETIPLSGFVFSAFAGVPVHLFENQIGLDWGDWQVGSSVQWNPVSSFRFRFDYSHIKDKNTGFRVSEGKEEDDLLGLSLWIDVGEKLDLYSRFTTFADDVRDVEAAATLLIPGADLTFRLAAYRLLASQDIRVIDWDAFSIAGSYRPYTQVSLNATKGLGPKFSVDGGFAARILDADQDASAFNHGFKRGYFSVMSDNFLLKQLSLAATVDYFNGDDNTLENNSLGGSFSFSKTFQKTKTVVRNEKKKKVRRDFVTLDVGTAYSLFRYNLATGNESDDVQTYFGGVQWHVTEKMNLQTHYEFEDNDFGNFQELSTQWIWEF